MITSEYFLFMNSANFTEVCRTRTCIKVIIKLEYAPCDLRFRELFLLWTTVHDNIPWQTK